MAIDETPPGPLKQAMPIDMTSAQPLLISAFYHFGPIADERLDEVTAALKTRAEELKVRGLVILATEGINGTCAGEPDKLREFLAEISKLLSFPPLPVKETTSFEWPFHKFKVRLREEIVTLGKPEVQPHSPASKTHLSPEEWDQMMEDPDAVVIDTRNIYETRIGIFKGAVDPRITKFTEFSEFMKNSEIPRDKKVMIYCTGGIRCEKATVDLEKLGFKNVYQLDGGILNYFRQRPESKFEGECFVFDNRVAVDQQLEPTEKYKLCPHCGQPADVSISCKRCDSPSSICPDCAQIEAKNTCSKNCAHHWQTSPGKKGRNQGPQYRRQPTARRNAHHLA